MTILSLPIITIIFLLLSSIFTSIISAVIGMAGGIVLLSIMTFFLSYQQLIPIHGFIQLISNSSRTWMLRTHVKKPIFFMYSIGAPFGAAIATYWVSKVENKEVFFLMIAALIFYALFKPKNLPHLKIPNWCFAIVGVFSGLLSVLVGATGPFLAVFFLRDDLKKEEIIATKSAVQIFGHLLKIPAYIYLGFPYLEHLPILIIFGIAAVIGTKIGVHILHKVNEKLFFLIFRCVLFLVSLRLVYKAVHSYL